MIAYHLNQVHPAAARTDHHRRLQTDSVEVQVVESCSVGLALAYVQAYLAVLAPLAVEEQVLLDLRQP